MSSKTNIRQVSVRRIAVPQLYECVTMHPNTGAVSVEAGGSISDSGPSHSPSRTCQHNVTEVLDEPMPVAGTHNQIVWSGPGGHFDTTPATFTFGYTNNLSTKTVGIKDVDVQSAVASAFTSVRTSPYQTMMNIPQAILELKDMKQTITSCNKLFRWLLTIPKVRRYTLLLGSLQAACEAYLTYVFGIAPTIRDVHSFIGQVPKRVRLGVRHTEFTRGQTVCAGIRVVNGEEAVQLSDINQRLVNIENVYNFGSNDGIWATVYGANSTSMSSSSWPTSMCLWDETSAVGCCYGRVAAAKSYDIPILDDVSFNADLWSTAYELTPFSFVLDWFVDIGQWIRQTSKIAYADSHARVDLVDGVWLSLRKETKHYAPQLFCTSGVTCSESHVEGSMYWIGRANGSIQWSYVQHVISKTRSYSRDRIGAGVLAPKVHSMLTPFQASAGLALAINQSHILQGLL